MTMRLLPATFRSFLILALITARQVSGEAPHVLREGKLPNDARLAPLKDLDGYFPFTPPATKAEWEIRAERVRRQILVSQG